MPSFEYEAVTADGQRVSSVAFGRDVQDVMLSLTQRGYQVLNIEDAYAKSDPLHSYRPAATPPSLEEVPAGAEVPEPTVATVQTGGTIVPPEQRGTVQAPPLERRNPIITHLFGPIVRVPWKDLTFFFRQLGTMIEAGVPMVQTLDTLASQSRDVRLRKVITEMRQGAEVGLPFSAILQRYPEMFSPLIISLIRAGEEGGFLAATCKQVSDYLNQEIELRNMYRRETLLPKLYLVFSIIIIGLTNLIVSAVGGANLIDAPLNRISTWYWLGPILIGLFLFFRVGLGIYGVRINWDRFVLRVPYIGKTAHHFAMAKFGRAFGALHRGGVPVTRSIHLAADASGNEWIRGQIYPVVGKIQEGAGIHETLANTGAFNPIVLNMMATGEMTGSLDEMLLRVSEFYEDEAKVRAKQTAQAVGVAVALAVGIYIGYIVITFWKNYFAGMMNEADHAGD